MITFAELFFGVVPVFLLLGAGAGARHLTWITASGEQTLLKLVINLFYPTFLFALISQNRALKSEGVIVAAILIGLCFVLIGYAIFYLAGPLFGIREKGERRAFSFTGGVYNYGYFAIPVCSSVFGREATGVMMVVVVGVELAMWSVGVFLVSGAFDRSSLKRMISPPVIAIFSGIVVNLLGITPLVPDFAMETLELLGGCAVPLGLIMIGATIFQLMQGVPVFTHPSVAIGASLLRLGVMPLVLIGGILALGDALALPVVLQQVALVHATMPCGVFPIVLTRLFGGRTDIALRTVIPTCFLSLLSIPVWIKVGLVWFGW